MGAAAVRRPLWRWLVDGRRLGLLGLWLCAVLVEEEDKGREREGRSSRVLSWLLGENEREGERDLGYGSLL